MNTKKVDLASGIFIPAGCGLLVSMALLDINESKTELCVKKLGGKLGNIFINLVKCSAYKKGY